MRDPAREAGFPALEAGFVEALEAGFAALDAGFSAAALDAGLVAAAFDVGLVVAAFDAGLEAFEAGLTWNDKGESCVVR